MDTDKLFPTKTRNPDDELPATADEAASVRGKWSFGMPEISGQQVGAVLSSLLLMGIGASIMNMVYPFFHPVTFNNVTAYYEQVGEPWKAKKIAQIVKACPDSAEIEMACIALDESRSLRQISQALPGGFRK